MMVTVLDIVEALLCRFPERCVRTVRCPADDDDTVQDSMISK